MQYYEKEADNMDVSLDSRRENVSANRITFIDSIKGFAIICVVLGHIVGGYYDSNIYPSASDLLYIIHNLIYTFHMPLFMTVSGYVYYMAYYDENGQPKRKKIYRQIINMCYIYIFFSIIYGAVKIALSGYVTSEISIRDIVQIPLKPIALYWYLYALIILYLLFSCNAIGRLGTHLLGYTFAISILGQFSNILVLDFSRWMYFSFYFYIGFAYRKYGKWFFSKNRYILPMFSLSIILVVVLWDSAKERAVYIHEIPIIRLLVALGIMLAIWQIFEEIHSISDSKFLSYVGRHSLEIYVLHGFFVSGLRIIFNMAGLNNVCLNICIDLFIGVFLPIFFSEICKRLNMYNLLFKPTNYIMPLRKDNSN